MSRDKKIEEIELTEVDILANDLNQHCADLTENYCGGLTCLSCLAHALTEKGYRKASEVAREIFEEIDKIIDKHYNKHIFDSDLEDTEKEAVMDFHCDVQYDIDELKKKYKESKE